MGNSSRAFGFITRNSSRTRHWFLMSKKGIRVGYPELMTLLSIFKGCCPYELK